MPKASKAMKQKSDFSTLSASPDSNYSKPMLTEIASLTELTAGGAPSTGRDTQNCTEGTAQTIPQACV